jgi:outer membrane protein
MNMSSFVSINSRVIIAVTTYLLLVTVLVTYADDIPDVIRKAVDQEFPNAVINEVREEVYAEQMVKEIEITTEDGEELELLVSDSGEILSIEEEKELPLIGGELSLGLAVGMERDIYRDVGTEFQLAPFLMYENGPFEIVTTDGIGASLTFYQTSMFSAALKASVLPGGGYDPDDSKFLRGMEELNTLYSAGLEFDGAYEGWEAGLDVSRDISGEHDGYEIEISLAYPWVLAGFRISPEISFTWMSEEEVDYFFGVSEAEARSGRPAYSPGSSYEIGAEIMIQRPLFGELSIIGIVGVSTFGNDITGSPLVDEDYCIEGALGVGYTF